MQVQVLGLLPLWYAAFLLSLTGHEAAHGWVAHRGGDDTAYRSGQVTLNPFPHMLREPLGTVVIPLLTFLLNGWMMGWASAPYDPRWEDRHPGRAAAMSAAGPAANLLLAVAAFAILKAGLLAGWWAPVTGDALALDRLVVPEGPRPGLLEPVARFLAVLLCLNVILAVLNLIPVPPLDGIAVLAGVVPPVRALRRRLRGQPFVALIGILVVWQLSVFVLGPVLRLTVRALLYD